MFVGCVVLATGKAFINHPSSNRIRSAPDPLRYSSILQNILTTTKEATKVSSEEIATNFIDAWNQGNFKTIESLCASDFTAKDTRFWKTKSLAEWERHSQLERHNSNDVIIDIQQILGDKENAAVQYQLVQNGKVLEYSRGALVFEIDENSKVREILRIQETANKNGKAKLNLLSYATQVMTVIGYNPAANAPRKSSRDYSPPSASLPEKYFAAWNRRDMKAALDVFDNDIEYDDTAFDPFIGKAMLERHLNICADAFPSSFEFVIDRIIENKRIGSIATEWHIENKGEPLPFTAGCSFYQSRRGTIVKGIDFIESSPPKAGNLNIVAETLKSNLRDDSTRFIPLLVWVTYMYVVFLSDGILPGANALELEVRTWEEVRDLSLNFFLVSPLLNLPFSPSVHPMLEGVFNLLLSWAAMFAGFLSDERRDKANAFGIIPCVAGMQLLTSAFLLPYLVLRSNEKRTDVAFEELSATARLLEGRALGPAMGAVGSGAVVWAFTGRPEFGDLSTRLASFVQLLSIDRVGSSFLVDLAIFALFQSYFVDDDLKRRGVGQDENEALRKIGKYVPFLGLAAYLALRPSFPSAVDN